MAVVAAPFQNGSFESPLLANATALSIDTPNAAPAGWLGGGTLGNFALFHQSNLYLTAQSGQSSIGFGGNGATGATIGQSFDTVVGVSYTVGFFTSAQQIGSGPQSYKVEALNGATVLGSDTGSIPAVLTWAPHTFNFVAASASTQLLFTDISNGGAAVGINWALDSVSVSAVPEPGAFGLMAAGLLVMALGMRRSTQR